MAEARHGTCELMRHGVAGERHGRGMTCELAFTDLIISSKIMAIVFECASPLVYTTQTMSNRFTTDHTQVTALLLTKLRVRSNSEE
jgi:hypothetical protein